MMIERGEPSAGERHSGSSQPDVARANRRTLLVLGLVAFGIYAYFILRHVFRAEGG